MYADVVYDTDHKGQKGTELATEPAPLARWAPSGLGAIIAVVVLIFAVLIMAGVIQPSPVWIGGLIAALAVARLT